MYITCIYLSYHCFWMVYCLYWVFVCIFCAAPDKLTSPPPFTGLGALQLKTAMYILNRVPSKAVPKTSFELWTGRKPSLKHLHVWGCRAEARIYNPHEKKLDSRTISGYFIGYPDKSKGYKFYCPNHTMRIVETGN